MSSTKQQLENLYAALDDVPIAAEEAKAVVADLGIEVSSVDAGLRAKIRVANARAAYAQEVERFELRKNEPARSRGEQLEIFHSLFAKAKARTNVPLALHFLKYESSSDEELGELIRSLRHLLDEPTE